MATGVVTWSKTANSNAAADAAQNWAEGMAPSAVNDSARGGMSSVAKWRDDLNGTLTLSGSSTAYVLATNQVFSALVAGYEVAFAPNVDCGSIVTLNVDGLGAKPLRSAPNVDLSEGQLKAGAIYRATYATSNSGEWLLQSVTQAIGVITPETYGATGDGVTDDTTAMAAALTALQGTGKILELRAGRTYLLSSWVSTGFIATGKLTIRGNGAMIKGPVAASHFLRPALGFDVQGVTFERWGYVLSRLDANGSSFTDSVFSNNLCKTISGISVIIEVPISDSFIENNDFDGGTSSTNQLNAVVIGQNDLSKQSDWARVTVRGNTVRNLTTSGTHDTYGLLLYGRDCIVTGNKIFNLRSQNAACIGIYTKLTNSAISYNTVRDVNSTGSTGSHLDVVGISLKGDVRSGVGPSPHGYKNSCIGNVVRTIGAQGVKGTGIRTQNAENIIGLNSIEDVGFCGIDDNDGTGVGSIIFANTMRGFNILGTIGIYINAATSGAEAVGNSITDFTEAFRLVGSAGTLSRTKISENTFTSNVASAIGFRFNSGTINGVDIVQNTVTLPATGTVVVYDTTGFSGVRILNNDLAAARASGATFRAGTQPTGTAIRGNAGYPSRTGGLVSGVPQGGGGTTVTHGLISAPSVISATARNTTQYIATSHTVTSSQFQIAHNAAVSVDLSYEAAIAEEFN